MKTLALVLASALSACGFTQEGDMLRAGARDKGAQAYDAGLENAEWFICKAASVDSIRRKYGKDPELARAYNTICSYATVLPLMYFFSHPDGEYMDLKKTFATDETLEETGVWVDFGQGAQFKIARFGNKKHREAMEKLRAPHKASIASGRTLSSDITDRMLLEATAEAILLDWRGVEEDGQPVKFTKEKAKEYLTELKDFRQQVEFICTQMETYRRQVMEIDAGNSSPSSTG